MTKFSILCGAMLLASVPAMAQDVVVDDFEGYDDSAAAKAVYVSKAGNGGETVELETSGGADDTDKNLRLVDNGYTAGIGADDIITPPAGTYTLSFWYKNGTTYVDRWRGIKVSIFQGGSLIEDIIVDPGTTAEANLPVTDWTLAETEAFSLTNDPISIRFDAPSGNGANPSYLAWVDEIQLNGLEGPALSVWPDDRVYLSGTETIVANPEGGSGSYTSVTFDVNNDGTVEHTATAEPFEFTWNTLDHVAADTSRTASADNSPIQVKVTVTDSDTQTKDLVLNYTVDNEFGGRTSMIVNGDFSEWADGENFGSNLPVGWVEHLVSQYATYGPGESHSPEASPALRIQYAGPNATDNSDRYTLRTVGQQGRYKDMQATWWGKGSFARLYYFTSEDDVTYTNSFQTAGEANSTVWIFVVESPVQNNLGLTDTSYVSLATHVVAGQAATTTPVEHFWDDITWEGNLLPPATSDVSDWKLY